MPQPPTLLKGKELGPTSIILAGIHGNEKCGMYAFKKLLPKLRLERGQVWFVCGNPRALIANKRYTEANLNRMFKSDKLLSQAEKLSYEYRRAQFLKKYLNRADALLDIHASRTPKSKRFVIGEHHTKNILKFLPFDLVVSGLDRVQPGGTDYYMNRHGKIGICIECGHLGDVRSAEVAEKSILAFLAARGHITTKMRQRKQRHVRVRQIYITKCPDFIVSKPFADFEKISKAQIIGHDGDTEVRARKDAIILFVGNREKAGDEAFLLGEYKKGPSKSLLGPDEKP